MPPSGCYTWRSHFIMLTSSRTAEGASVHELGGYSRRRGFGIASQSLSACRAKRFGEISEKARLSFILLGARGSSWTHCPNAVSTKCFIGSAPANWSEVLENSDGWPPISVGCVPKSAIPHFSRFLSPGSPSRSACHPGLVRPKGSDAFAVGLVEREPSWPGIHQRI